MTLPLAFRRKRAKCLRAREAVVKVAAKKIEVAARSVNFVNLRLALAIFQTRGLLRNPRGDEWLRATRSRAPAAQGAQRPIAEV